MIPQNASHCYEDLCSGRSKISQGGGVREPSIIWQFFVENYMKLDRAESPAPNPTPGSAYVFTLVWNILLWTS